MNKLSEENISLLKDIIFDRMDLAFCSLSDADIFLALRMYLYSVYNCNSVYDNRLTLCVLELINIKAVKEETIQEICFNLSGSLDWKSLIFNNNTEDYFINIRLAEIRKQKYELMLLDKKISEKTKSDDNRINTSSERKRGRPRKVKDIVYAEA